MLVCENGKRVKTITYTCNYTYFIFLLLLHIILLSLINVIRMVDLGLFLTFHLYLNLYYFPFTIYSFNKKYYSNRKQMLYYECILIGLITIVNVDYFLKKEHCK